MKRKVLSLLLVMAMGMSLLVGCGGNADKGGDNGKDTNVNQEDNKEDANVESAVLKDVWSNKRIEITYNKEDCEETIAEEYITSIIMKNGEIFEIEFHADYTAESFYNEESKAILGNGLKALELVDYSSADMKVFGYEVYESEGEELYSCTLLHEIEQGVLVIHKLDLSIPNADSAKAYMEQLEISAKATTADGANAETEADSDSSSKKLALTNEEREAVYKADYEAIKAQIVREEKEQYGNSVSYYDANGLEVMYVYYDGSEIENAFFNTYNENGVKIARRAYSFQETGEYGFTDFEFYENGETKTETSYRDDGSKIVFLFDENGDFVSGTEYDKDGNVIE